MEYSILAITVKEGGIVDVGDHIRIVLEKRPKKQLRMYVKAPKDLKINRVVALEGCTDRFDTTQTIGVLELKAKKEAK
jgi:hypothetical protein